MTMMKTRPASTEAVDLTQIDHLNKHPALTPLFARRSELRARLDAVEEEGKALRRTLYGLRDDVTFAGGVQRREVEDKLADRERAALSLETALRTLQVEVEAAGDRGKAELTPLLAGEGTAPVQELLDALERLAHIAPRVAAFSQRSRRLLGTSLASLPWTSPALDACIKQMQHMRERLQRLSAP